MGSTEITAIRLELEYIYHAKHDKTLFERRENELTEEDHEFYNKYGWDNFRPENHIDYLYPTLGESLYFLKSTNPVIEINRVRYKLSFDFNYDYKPYEAEGKAIVLTPTDEPLSKSDNVKVANRHNFYMQIFGQPRWVQGDHYIVHNGKPCYHLATIETGWGDSGNYNILIGCDDQGVPTVAYFEASCC
jgi:hypothetical protein